MIRLVARLTAMFAIFLICVPLHHIWRLVGRHSSWPQLFLGWIAKATGMRVAIKGRPLPTHVLFLANHLSWLDILILAGASGTAFVSKGEVARWPVFGWLARMNNTVFIAREDKRTVMGQANALRTSLAAGQPIALFPEGTTDGGPDILPFRASLLAALFPPLPGIRVQPVAIDYGAAAHELAWVGDETAAANMKRILSRRGTVPITLHFLDPIDPAAAGDRKVLAERARAEIIAALRPSAMAGDRL